MSSESAHFRFKGFCLGSSAIGVNGEDDGTFVVLTPVVVISN